MSVDAIVGNAAPGWEWKGHAVRLLDLAALAAYERRVMGNHFNALQEMRQLYTEEQYERRLAEIQHEKAAGLYSLKGRIGAGWLATPDGLSFLLGLVLDWGGTKALDVWALVLSHPEDVDELVTKVMKDSGVMSDAMLKRAREKEGAKGKGPTGPFGRS